MALVRASVEAIGLTQLAESWGISLAANIFVDSSAALSVVSRKGNGKLRHVRIGHLWVQEAAEKGELVYRKVLGSANPADLMTKHLAAGRIEDLVRRLSQGAMTGSAHSRLQLDALAENPSRTVGPPANKSLRAEGESWTSCTDFIGLSLLCS